MIKIFLKLAFQNEIKLLNLLCFSDRSLICEKRSQLT